MHLSLAGTSNFMQSHWKLVWNLNEYVRHIPRLIFGAAALLPWTPGSTRDLDALSCIYGDSESTHPRILLNSASAVSALQRVTRGPPACMLGAALFRGELSTYWVIFKVCAWLLWVLRSNHAMMNWSLCRDTLAWYQESAAPVEHHRDPSTEFKV